jgi:lysophospholipase L1-like esterase
MDTLPANHQDFSEIERAATHLEDAHPGRLVFSIMLGTNDSAEMGPFGAPVAPQEYRRNLTTMIDQLLADFPGCEIVIHRPTWYSPNTYNASRYLQAGLSRLQSYFAEIDTLVAGYRLTHPEQVYLGDTQGFDLFKNQYRAYLMTEPGEQGNFYLHPNPQGAAVLGRLWGQAIAATLPRTD